MRAFYRPQDEHLINVFNEFEQYWELLFEQAVIQAIVSEKNSTNGEPLSETTYSYEVIFAVAQEFKNEVKIKTLEEVKILSDKDLILFKHNQEIDFQTHSPFQRKWLLRNLFKERASGDNPIQVEAEAIFNNALEAYSNSYLELGTELKEMFHSLGVLDTSFLLNQDTNVERVVKELNSYGFSEHLSSKGLKLKKITQMLDHHSGRKFVAYSIALLHHIGFYSYFLNTHFEGNATNANRTLGKIFEKDPRTIRGCVDGLNVNSNDAHRYKSYLHTEHIVKDLGGCK